MDKRTEFEVDARVLRQTWVLRDLEPEALHTLWTGAQRRVYARHELISNVEADGAIVWLLVSGAARLYRLSAHGHEITLAQLAPGDLLGQVSTQSPSHPVSWVEATADETVMYRIPRSFFWRFIASYPSAALEALDLLSRRLGDAYDRIEDLALCDTRNRLARVLARLATADDAQIVSTTHDELARLAGTTREGVTKVLCHFRRCGLVAYQPHHRGIAILDVDRLLAETSSRR